MDFETITRREEREAEGLWIKIEGQGDVAPGQKPAEVLVTGIDHPRYTQTLYMKMLPLRQKHGKDEIPEKEREECIADALAECVLKGWRGITEKGVEVPFTVDTARKWLRASIHFRDMVSGAAMKASGLLQQEYRADVLALKKTSAPASKGQQRAQK